MTTSENAQGTAEESAEPQTIDEIEAEIEATREELGATVDELSHRLDVKGRAQDKVSDIKVAASEKAGDVKTVVTEKTSVLGEQVKHTATDVTEKVKPLAQRREVQAAAAGALLLGVGAAVVSHRRK
ncbi:hypothetical protein GCM10009547_11410 [Sporichthya brevicatena]|uniref:DUF3618 domain-containing protein n=1 Tax=Sporichthya brevicatena TaxID=171442 RepID=A0ABN1GGI9_9ACTN